MLSIPAPLRLAATIHSFSEQVQEQTKTFIDASLTSVIKKMFYVGYNILPQDIGRKRNADLAEKYGAIELNCENSSGQSLQVRYISSKSTNKTNNVLVICLNTTYEDHNPRHWEVFLENGADIVLWNPSKTLPTQYEHDLKSVLDTLKKRNPSQIIGLKAYCASTEPAIAAASQMPSPIHIICDRGFGDVLSLARSNTIFSKWSLIEHTLTKYFSCNAVEKIKQIAGRVLFFIPQNGADQVMQWGVSNLTEELAHEMSTTQEKEIVYIPGDHWSKWGKTAYVHALEFLTDIGITSSKNIDKNKHPDPEAPGTFKSRVIPFLTKAWC